jgi:hypothetical protein
MNCNVHEKGKVCNVDPERNEAEFETQTQKEIPTIIGNLEETIAIKQIDLLSLRG